jgi:dTDP-4-dehydrorhamnose 3,5-epimerase
MTHFSFEPSEIPDVVRIRTRRFRDSRGFFSERFRRSAYQEAGIPDSFAQDNWARSEEGVLRGLHYQLAPRAQGKLVGVIQGRIWDVAVDIRVGSPTFGRWVGAELDEASGDLLWIPPGFAHGYQVLSTRADVIYKVTREYDPDLDRGIRWDDPDLGIRWPHSDPVLSDRDRGLPSLGDAEFG